MPQIVNRVIRCGRRPRHGAPEVRACRTSVPAVTPRRDSLMRLPQDEAWHDDTITGTLDRLAKPARGGAALSTATKVIGTRPIRVSTQRLRLLRTLRNLATTPGHTARITRHGEVAPRLRTLVRRVLHDCGPVGASKFLSRGKSIAARATEAVVCASGVGRARYEWTRATPPTSRRKP